LWGAKAKTTAAAGAQLYADHPPHLTLYLAAFEDPQSLLAAVEELANRWPPPVFELIGWSVFYADVLAGGNTVVCKMAEDSASKCRMLQAEVIRLLAPHRDEAASKLRYEARWEALTLPRQRAAEDVGFPFIGDDWQPHFTVASIATDQWEAAWPLLERDPIAGTFTAASLTLYALENGHPVPLSCFPFAGD
jgi:2'-5' RNA ligase